MLHYKVPLIRVREFDEMAENCFSLPGVTCGIGGCLGLKMSGGAAREQFCSNELRPADVTPVDAVTVIMCPLFSLATIIECQC